MPNYYAAAWTDHPFALNGDEVLWLWLLQLLQLLQLLIHYLNKLSLNNDYIIFKFYLVYYLISLYNTFKLNEKTTNPPSPYAQTFAVKASQYAQKIWRNVGGARVL
jgi:hypothetical protein